jgi:hypothetical protein
MSYFWLGYGHAIGKNVIPITKLVSLTNQNDVKPPQSDLLCRAASIEADRDATRGKVVDLAFDIRAQRHMTFDPERPELLEHQLEQTLTEMIRADFSEWSRKWFWTKLLGSRGVVSIITGGLHSDEHSREMIGDWDLRAASELTSYFSRHQYRPKIETPIYQFEYAKKLHPELKRRDYIEQIIGEIEIGDKNCVIIASPDVNPLTEMILGRINKVDDDKLFSRKFVYTEKPDAIVVIKKRKMSDASPPREPEPRAFFQDEIADVEIEERGFKSKNFAGEDDTRTLRYWGQNSSVPDEGFFHIYAHLVIAVNPFTRPGQPTRYVIVLNGVSGPATFALTHVLTGGGNEEFEAYKKVEFDPAAASESILNQFLPVIHRENFTSLECVIKVDVGLAPPEKKEDRKPDTRGSGATFDWRKIRRWELDHEVLGRRIKVR